MKFIAALIGAIVFIALIVAAPVGYIIHLVYCFQHHEWIRLIVLAILAPLGVLDGYGIWFHWW